MKSATLRILGLLGVLTAGLMLAGCAETTLDGDPGPIPLAGGQSCGSIQQELNRLLGRGVQGSVEREAAGQQHPAVSSRMGEDVGNRKTNAANKSDEEACRWVTLSVLKAFQDNAKARGANAVIDIVSYYKKREFRSATNYECYAGAFVAGIVTQRQRPATAKGTIFVTLEDEHGMVNVVVWSHVALRDRKALLGSRLMAVRGRWEQVDGVEHLIARRLEDFTALLGEIQPDSRDFH